MMRSEGIDRLAIILSLVLAGQRAGAQERREPARAQAEADIRRALRAFYFSLAHHDWEAVTAGILPAKVVAHHAAPATIVAASETHVSAATCAPTMAGRVAAAELTLSADWAAVTVARCGKEREGEEAGVDEFRLIDFDGRWWIVYIDLADEAGVIQLAR